MVTVEAWYKALPPFTRYWFSSSVVTAVSITLGIPLARYLVWSWSDILYGQIWRILTCFTVFGKLDFSWAMSMYLICQYVRELEMTGYSGRRGAAELIYVAMFGVLSINLLLFLDFRVFPATCLLSMFVYLWSRILPHAPIAVYGFTLQRWHTPAVIIVLNLLTSTGPPFDPIFGVAIGHTWKMLTEILPRVYGKTLLTCPEFVYRLIDSVWPRLVGEPVADPAVVQRPAWQQGAGHRLGD